MSENFFQDSKLSEPGEKYPHMPKICPGGLALDLRDGIRLSRLLELMTQDWGLSKKLRLPATSLNPRLGNTKLFLDKLEELTHFNFNISSRDIAIGHKEKTLSLIWALIFHFRIAIKLDDALLRREIAFIRAKHSILESWIPDKLGSINGSNQFDSVTLQLLLEWTSVICRVFGLRVTDFTSSFKDGRALCYILHYYHPALLSKHFISGDPKSNLEEFSKKLSSLGEIPTLPPSSDFYQTGPNEKVVIMYLAYSKASTSLLQRECIPLSLIRGAIGSGLLTNLLSLSERTRGVLLGRKSLGLRICACPKRDSKVLSSAPSKKPRISVYADFNLTMF